MARYDDLNTNAIAYTTFVSCVLLLIIIFLTQALCFNWLEAREEMRVGKESYTASDAIIATQRKSLEGYRPVEVPAPAQAAQDASQRNQPPKMIKKIQIPLERAVELILKDAQPAETPKT